MDVAGGNFGSRFPTCVPDIERPVMIRLRYAGIIILLAVASAVWLRAQEVQRPLDRDGKLDRLDQETEAKVHLFPSVQGFREVYLFQLPDSSYVLEVWYHRLGQVYKDRRYLSTAGADSFRTVVSTALHQYAPLAGVNQAGRSRFVGNMYALALGFYGWGIPYVTGLEDELAFGTYLLLGAGGIFITHSATRDAEISEETANLASYASWLGIAHGGLLHAVLHGEDATTKGYVGTAMIVGAAEGVTGFLAGNRLKLGSGPVELLGTCTVFGLSQGYGVAYVTDVTTVRGKAAATLIGSLAGILQAALLISAENYTAGDAAIFRTGAVLGTYLPIAFYDIAGGKNPKTRIALAVAGSFGGGAIGHVITRGKDFTTAQGNYVSLGTMGGALIGLGISAIAKARPELTHTLTSTGAILGFLGMYNTYAPEAVQTDIGETSALRMDMNPMALVTGFGGRTPERLTGNTLPFLTLRYTF